MATRRPKKQPKRKAEDQPAAESEFNMQINGHMLSGKTVGGRWVWTCPSWPDLAGLHSGKTDAAPMVEEFTGRAMVCAPPWQSGLSAPTASPTPGDSRDMAGFFYDLTNPSDGHLSSFNVTMNDDGQCVLTQLDSSGKPCDFSTHEGLEDLLLSLARAEAGDNGYHQVWIQRADDGYLCENLMSVGTWQEVADTLNGPDGKDKWVMYGRWATLMPFDYVGSNGQHFAVTDLGKRLDAMHKQD